MALPDETDLAKVTDRQIRDSLTSTIFELNLLLRIASLRGIPATLDLHEVRDDPAAHPDGYTKLVAPDLGP